MNETEEIKSRLPIEQVVGSFVPLKKAGRIYKACCPFHNEKTPSFTVSPDRGIYKCFGCGEGGDIFDFVMKIEGTTFPEALEMLAQRAGVILPDHKKEAPNPNIVPKQRLFQLNTYVSKLWNKVLLTHPKAEVAREYLKKRGLTTKTIEEFQIGYAPFGQGTSTGLKQEGFSQKDISQAGDPTKFQDRITFPIADITGRTVGFTGRLLKASDDPHSSTSRGPKYWNTPETSLFIKSRAVYGLHLAKKQIQDDDLALLVEGQMDVVMLHQNEFRNTVASSGTALTKEQIQLLGRFTTNIVFAYDQDKAGITATKRGIELVLDSELNPFVIVVPDGKDPAECLLNHPETWQEAYENRQHAVGWLIDQTLKENDGLTPVHKKEIVQTLLPWLARLTNEIERNDWIRLLAGRIQTDEKNISTALSRLIKPQQTSAKKVAPTTSKNVNLAELATAILLAFPNMFSHIKDQIPSLSLQESTDFLQKILPLLETADQDLTGHLKTKLSEQEFKEVSLYIQELLQPYNEIETDEAWALQEFMVLTRRIRSDSKEGAKALLAGQIRLAEQQNDTKKLQELFSELKNLI